MSGERVARIVLVDDSSSDAGLLVETLREQGIEHNLRHYTDGDEALRALSEQGAEIPDLILLDLNLPTTEGLDVLTGIRETAHLADVPVVILSGSGVMQDRINTALLGATAYIQKPATLDGFINEVGGAVKEMLGSRKR